MEVYRIEKLQKLLLDRVCVVEDPIDLYYLTGLSFSAGQLWITRSDALLLVDGRYIQVAGGAPCPSALLSKEAALQFCQKNKVEKGLFDGEKLSFDRAEELKKLYPMITWRPLTNLTKPLRIEKDAEEIALLQKSADLVWKGFTHVQSLLVEGITEKEIARQFTLFCLEQGADSIGFDPIIAFGENSAMPHYRAGDRKLKKGDIVLVDIGVVLDRYHSDMTRTFFFGPKDPLLATWHAYVIEAYEAAVSTCKAGVLLQELDKAAREVFRKYGVEEYFIHSLGHGVGLQIHESPKIRFDLPESQIPLTPQMVFTIEPGLYLPGRGGIRHENTLVFTNDGCKSLTPNIFVFD